MLVIRKTAFWRNFQDLISPTNSVAVLINSREAHSKRRFQQHPRLPVKNVNKSTKPAGLMDENADIDVDKLKREFRKDLKEEFQKKGDIEDSIEELMETGYDEVRREAIRGSQMGKRSKMFRKHFREYVEKELNLLTYSEKEKIKYLHNSNPDEWTPEVLAASFPISAEGAYKIIKSTFKARSIQVIKEHDEIVVDRIRSIKYGAIPLTPELEVRMKMRENMPLKVGAFDPYDKNTLLRLTPPPKVIGEFQSLVTPPQLVANSKSTDNPQREGNNLPALKAVADESVRTRQSFKDTEEPDLGDYYTEDYDRKVTKDLRKSNIPNKPMTYTEFITKLKKSKKESANPEVSHLQKHSKNSEDVKSAPLEDVQNEIEQEVSPMNIQRFKHFNKTDKSEANNFEYKQNKVDNRFQRSSTESHLDSISIPDNIKKDGAVYRKGSSFYDENGSFLYRVL